MQIAQDKQSADQGKEAKRSVQGTKKTRTTSGHHGWPVFTTTVRSGHHGQPVVEATAVVALRLPVVAGFSCDASFCPAINVRLLLVFAFKEH